MSTRIEVGIVQNDEKVLEMGTIGDDKALIGESYLIGMTLVCY
jgi:hypothetical protein